MTFAVFRNFFLSEVVLTTSPLLFESLNRFHALRQPHDSFQLNRVYSFVSYMQPHFNILVLFIKLLSTPNFQFHMYICRMTCYPTKLLSTLPFSVTRTAQTTFTQLTTHIDSYTSAFAMWQLPPESIHIVCPFFLVLFLSTLYKSFPCLS